MQIEADELKSIRQCEAKLEAENAAIIARRVQLARDLDWCKHIVQFITMADLWEKQLHVGWFYILPWFRRRRHDRMMDQVLDQPVLEDLKRPYPQDQGLKERFKNYQAALRRRVYCVHARVKAVEIHDRSYRVPGFKVRKSVHHDPVDLAHRDIEIVRRLPEQSDELDDFPPDFPHDIFADVVPKSTYYWHSYLWCIQPDLIANETATATALPLTVCRIVASFFAIQW
jgi:hypothetical protein